MNLQPPAGKPLRIIQLTDFHLLADPARTMMGMNTQASFLAALEDATRRHQGIDLFLMTGDLAQDPLADTYRRLKTALDALPAPSNCLQGNHDDPALIRQVLVNDKISFQSRILLDGWQILCLDSTVPRSPVGALRQEQMELLELMLKERLELNALVCLHHSPLATGAAWLDTMKLTNGGELLDLVRRFPRVKGVVYGHIHQAMDVELDGLRLLGCPSTCFQFKPGSKDFALDHVPQGYRLIELHPDGRIDTKVLRLESVPEGLDVSSGGY